MLCNPRAGTLNCINVIALSRTAFVQVKAVMTARLPAGNERRKTEMLTTWENFTLRARRSYQAVAADWQRPVVRDPAR